MLTVCLFTAPFVAEVPCNRVSREPFVWERHGALASLVSLAILVLENVCYS